MKLAINGLGRIGRLTLRHLVKVPGLEIVGVNDQTEPRILAHLIKHDSVHGRAAFSVSHEIDALVLDGVRIPVFRESDPAQLPFGTLGARLVLECTGRFSNRAGALNHLRGGVERVLISAPSEDADRTLVMGVNEATLQPTDRILSAASCTTNGLAIMAKVLDDAFGLEYGLMTAVNSYTSDQNILDLPHEDLRRARAASMSMIPTSTGAAQAIGLVLPHLSNRLDGIAVRVPTPDVSLTDLTALLRQSVTRDDVNRAFEAAAHGPLQGYLEVLDEELVSTDLVGREASCLFDPFLTKVMDGTMTKVHGWYDNEWGYAARMRDLAVLLLGVGLPVREPR
ncbi:MAG: type I glyceraldehyde-3-phosphate dehydrogenase [Holophaga sp.]|nr:type I glyceraldehyde-3-phosphate dehydrogenase [Holophaga sp.]